MKNFYKIIILVLIVLAIVFTFFYFAKKIPAPEVLPKPISQVCFNQNCFFVELATTQAQQEQGLMNRTSLNKNNGMFFIFSNEGNYPFWMKNTLIPLDIIWIDSNNKIVFIKQNAEPCKTIICPIVNPNVNAKYVLEINAGLSKEFDIKIGAAASF